MNKERQDEIDLGDRRLKKYDLYYCDDDGNEIQ